MEKSYEVVYGADANFASVMGVSIVSLFSSNTDAQETVKEVNQFIETMKGYIPKVIDFAINVIIAIIIFMIGKYVISLILKIFKLGALKQKLLSPNFCFLY